MRSRSGDFCCKRGHFAILPLNPIPPRTSSAHCATDAPNPSATLAATPLKREARQDGVPSFEEPCATLHGTSSESAAYFDARWVAASGGGIGPLGAIASPPTHEAGLWGLSHDVQTRT